MTDAIHKQDQKDSGTSSTLNNVGILVFKWSFLLLTLKLAETRGTRRGPHALRKSGFRKGLRLAKVLLALFIGHFSPPLFIGLPDFIVPTLPRFPPAIEERWVQFCCVPDIWLGTREKNSGALWGKKLRMPAGRQH